MIVNGNIYAERLNYPRRAGTKYLLGPGYSCIRSAFRRIAGKGIGKEVRSIMVTLGGCDSHDLMPGIIDRIQKEFRDVFIHVVIGRGFHNIAAIQAAAAANTRLYYFPDADGMRDIMLASDIAVSSGGQTLYELARTGIPAIALAAADNQILNVEEWAKTGFVESAGDSEDPELLANICVSIGKLSGLQRRREMSAVGRRMIDGKGPARVVNAILREMTHG
jgi:UDP-2,4-diacetamido-2,4,6-trideoxy-beta-L-altropyranose hydrolase